MSYPYRGNRNIRHEPRVSIVLPARNAAATLVPCLASILRQTLTHWECLLVDDGSTDGTLALAEEAARHDSRFRLVSTPPRGLIAALDEGVRLGAAPFIARMDADDVMHRDRLAAQVAALEADPGLCGVGCHVRMFPRKGMTPGLRQYEAWLNSLRSADDVARDAYVECPIAHPTLMMRREMAALGYRDCGWPEDYDLVLRAVGQGMRVGVVPRRLLSWRDRADSLSRSDGRYGRAQFTACKAHYLAAGFLSGADDYILWGFGETGQALRRALASHGKHPSLIVEVKPSRVGKRIHGAPVIRPEALGDAARRPLVVSVAHAGPRAEIRGILTSMGFVEGLDFVCAA
ncbi:MAG: glycosyltransferase family 2 protein [Acidobacteria bacterium]|nr:MAG: glycosyltransferase family 2 protein [Acidobacteriota bacterium]